MKHKKSEIQKARQKKRTHKNKAKKYTKLLKNPHTSKEDKIFKEKLEFSQSKL